ncbi:glycosyltransferase family 4 protein [Undibacterium fentianense]|uniref:Glycosyltransferase family 4 protein n=1 Tax=Undibacterium fentianense TaxID=2828728 RepID=A0A941E8K7_9BURK|nr:glycosyltransferase family 4 protein [Undibacterium fentianense]MBR7801748.1 glycosyltransferase family 4 protein [Undibacterium fentianense]
MKLLVITHSFDLNGAAAILKTILHYWVHTLGWQVDIALRDKAMAEHGAALREAGFCPLVETKLPGDYDFALVNTLIDRAYIDHLYGKIPIVFWVHEGRTALLNIPDTPRKLINAFSKPDVLIFDSDWQIKQVFQSFLYHLPASRLHFAHCAVTDLSQHIQMAPKVDGARLSIICLGSVYSRKRQLDLAQAILIVGKKYKIKGRFVGSLKNVDTFGPVIQDFLHKFPSVLEWTGGVSETQRNEYLSQADIACFPSADETFGIAALEAASLGLPVILADLPVYDEVGWRHGENCLKFSVRNVNALAEQLEILVSDSSLRSRLSVAGKKLSARFGHQQFFDVMTNAVKGLKRQPLVQVGENPTD